MIEIVNTKIDTLKVLASVQSELDGAAILFVGSTRKMTGDKETKQLDYECYEGMAVKKMTELVEEAKSRWPVGSVSVVHRVGVVALGEASIAIAVGSQHRKPSFEAGEWLIDELKKQVPIWKKEYWADGSTEWVHPEGATPESMPSTAGSKQ